MPLSLMFFSLYHRAAGSRCILLFLTFKKKKALSCYKFVALMLCTKEEKGTCSRRLTCNADDSNPVSAG